MNSPTVADFQHHIGTLINRSDLSGAAKAAAQCRSAWPSDRSGWLLGSIVALLEERADHALALTEERLAADQGDVQCLLQKAECLMALGERALALAAADVAADRARWPVELDSIGDFYSHALEYGRAVRVYDRAVAAAPRDPTLLAKRAVARRFVGELDAAARDYEAVLDMLPGSAKALKGLVELRRELPGHNLVGAMQAALAAAPPESVDAARLHFALAKSHEDLGEHAASWRHLERGNSIERRRIDYQPAMDRMLMERLIESFPGAEDAPPHAQGSEEAPIFIVGLPRTGTTLIDRIVGGHSQVHSAGELPALAEALGTAIQQASQTPPADWHAYADALARLDGAVIAREYLARVRPWRGERPRFTDKQLNNFFFCGPILRAFPHAGIVHVTRHPLAACMAIYRNRFDGTYPFSYDLSEIGEFYIGYRKLMDHWRRVLPNRILDVAYEDVVCALEPTVRGLLDYLGLPFEQACLEFHVNPAPVRTASSVQVRQPLYSSSLDSWKHYADQLAPLRAQLEAAGIVVDPGCSPEPR